MEASPSQIEHTTFLTVLDKLGPYKESHRSILYRANSRISLRR
jgi:hypothetical protein